MNQTIFFSWQSDRPIKEGRLLVQKALEMAAARIAKDWEVEQAARNELVVDSDTRGVPGSPPIFQTILRKIDQASVFVSDLTFCGSRVGGRPTPNPNVLIEYGWALKSLEYLRVVAVMNEAYGQPAAESLPFDLAQLRFPITYNLPEGAGDGERRAVRQQLSERLETALRTIFESQDLKTKLKSEPQLPKFVRREPLEGRARFRSADKPLGFVRDSIAQMIGTPKMNPIPLLAGAAQWVRIMPTYAPGREWMVQDLKQLGLKIAVVPLILKSGGINISFLQDEDGCGYWPVYADDKAYAIAYMFKTGELWMIDASLARTSTYLELDEERFAKTVEQSALILDGLGCTRPYSWIVGLEGIRNRQLFRSDKPNRMFGQSMADVIEQEGILNAGDSAAEKLRPFFEKVFDSCGYPRPT